MKTVKKSLHFTITGEFITHQARSLWNAEDKPEQALTFLTESLPGLTEAQAIDICSGKAKLTGRDNKILLQPDNTTTDQYGNPLRNAIQTLATLRQQKNDVEDDLAVERRTGVWRASPWGMIHVPRHIDAEIRNQEMDWDNPFFKRYSDCYVPKTPERPFKNQNELDDPQGHLEPEELESEINQKPKPDSTLSSANGWIDPQGRFYPCEYGHHEELAEQLGVSGKIRDEECWLKTQTGLCTEGIFWNYDKQPNQAQINTAFEWCQKHRIKFPSDMLFDEKM